MLRSVIMVVLFVCFAGNAQATLIKQGESYSVSFDGIPLKDAGSETRNYGVGVLYFGDDRVEVGESVKIEFFEDRLGGDLLYSSIFDGPTSSIGATLMRSSVWQDLQGMIRLTVLKGTVDLVESWVLVSKDGDLYSQKRRYPPVSQVVGPNAILLFLVGCLAIFWLYGRSAYCRNLSMDFITLRQVRELS